MDKYHFALVRCVPNPRSGEFINVGAIAGSAATGDWSVREIGSERRVRSLADADDISTFHEFINEVGFTLDANLESLEHGSHEPLSDDWLIRLHEQHRNIVQLSKPSVILADNAEAALDLIFRHYIVDIAPQSRTSATKRRAVSALSEAYKRAAIEPAYIKRGAELVVGDHLTTKLDFAIGNGHAVQLSQGWSFQVQGINEIGTQIKSWAYALRRLREGIETRVIESNSRLADVPTLVDRDVDLEVVILSPQTPAQERVFDEANQVFTDLGVQVRGVEDAHEVGERALELIGGQPGQGRIHV